MAKIRVHELAKELGTPSKEMVTILQGLGLDVKNHMSTMEESQANWVKKQLAESGAERKVDLDNQSSRGHLNEANNKKGDQIRSMPGRNTGSPNLNLQNQKKKLTEGSQNVVPEKIVPPIGDQQPRRDQNTAPRTAGNQQPRRDQNTAPRTAGDQQPRRDQNTAPRTAGDQQPRRDQNTAPRTAGNQQPRRDQNTAPRTAGNQPEIDENIRTFSHFKKEKNQTRAFHDGDNNRRKDYSRPSKKSKHKHKKEENVLQTPNVITIEDSIVVRELAEKLGKSPAEIVKKLMELGTMASINQVIDYETAEIVASLFEVKVEKAVSEEEKLLDEIIDDEDSLEHRPPVVTVMGHVDHGKTSLLDKIRKADVASGEAGGITQHIGAYQVNINGSKVTFIDTPGHEAFTAMRARGANLTDIVVLVVAADDGVMPQTVEAINHIKAADVPFIVAVNKIDKPDANPDRVMQQLTEYNIVPEEWGGDTIFVPVSAKAGEGIDTLLEMILLVAEINEIRANPNRQAEGVVIEGKLDKGRGAIATVLVLKGTLRIGDCLVCGSNICKVRAMMDYRGRRVERALPSMPVEIMGWSSVPEAGAKVVVCDEKTAKQVVELRVSEKKLEDQKQSSRVSLDEFFKQMKDSEMKELNVIIKGDVQGSVEALAQSLLRVSTDEVKVNVIHSAVGAISETDVMLASASNAIIIGFNVRPESKARKYAEEEGIDVRLYRVIYEAIDDVKKAMAGLLEPEHREKYIGRAQVRATFKVPNVGVIAGSYVIEGKMQRNANIRVLRDGVVIYEGVLSSLKRFKDDAKEVQENYECGIGIKDFNDVKEDDIIEAFTLEEVPREL